MRPLDTDEHSVFFGRAREVDELAMLLRSPAERADPAALIVVGPSGCGKSSLVRAGLLPVMAAEPEWWTLPAILPGAHPVAALARELAASARQLGLAWTVTDVTRRLNDGELVQLVDDLLLAVPGRRRRHLLALVDQFEELLTQTGPEERVRFAELLRNALTDSVQVVATLRPEFLDQVLASPELSVLPARTHMVRPLRSEALRAVIEGPADRAGIAIDADLATRLVADTGGGEALPLLAYTLAQLTDGVTGGDRLSTARYEQLGGVQGALAGQADVALTDAVTAGGRDRDQVIRELLRLVTVDEQGRPTRWRVRRDELPGQVLTELQPFIDRRLLTTDAEHDHVVLGVAHEAFLSAWPPLEKAITASTAALRARRQVERAAAEWAEHRHAPARLWERGQLAAALADTGARLRSGRTTRGSTSNEEVPGPDAESASRWSRRRRILVADRVELSAPTRDFLRASIRRDRRRRGRAVTILSTLLLLALGLAVIAFDRQDAAQDQQRVAEERLRLATGRQLVAQAETRLDRDPRTALRLNEAAVHMHDSPETRSALVNNVLTTPYTGTLTGHDGPVRAVAFSPAGSLLASVGDDGTVRLWNSSDPAAPTLASGPLTGHNGPVTEVAFAPDGSLLASVGDDGTVRLWNIRDPAAATLLGTPLTGHDGPVTEVAFAPDGNTLASAGGDGTVRLWTTGDPAAPTPLGAPLTGHDGTVRAVAFAPDRPVLASAGDDGTVRLWNLDDPADPIPFSTPLTGHDGRVRAVAFASEGSLLASAGLDGTVRLWNTPDPAAPTPFGAPLTGHDGTVWAVAYAPDRPPCLPLLATTDLCGCGT
ncbi:NACHT and WD repeat domain-containing protein [Geodermatophilus sp. URMC 61]|uniref:NACHT and WD repeat domain-containing protein n=1 Tax=Geodermatophilus sp. URMC 61 TaxID=3423411 RepID=UPI00406CA6BA